MIYPKNRHSELDTIIAKNTKADPSTLFTMVTTWYNKNTREGYPTATTTTDHELY